MGTRVEATLSDAGEIIGHDKVVVLQPKTWVGKRCPLLAFIDIGEELKRGEWLVVLYRHDCPKCRQALPNLPLLVSEVDRSRVALIEMPPYANDAAAVDCSAASFARGALSEGVDWFAQTPVLVHLREGVVVQGK